MKGEIDPMDVALLTMSEHNQHSRPPLFAGKQTSIGGQRSERRPLLKPLLDGGSVNAAPPPLGSDDHHPSLDGDDGDSCDGVHHVDVVNGTINTRASAGLQRWWVLFVFSTLGVTFNLSWICFSAITNEAREFYGFTNTQINRLNEISTLVYFPVRRNATS